MNELDKSRFLALYCMILADGVIDHRELETLYRIGIEEYGFSVSEIAECIKSAGTSFVLPTHIEDKISLLYQLAQICVSDDDVSDTEVNLFNRYALKMGFEEDNIDGIREFLLDEAKKKSKQNDVINKIINE